MIAAGSTKAAALAASAAAGCALAKVAQIECAGCGQATLLEQLDADGKCGEC